MRECSTCHKQDAPWFEDAPCTCGQPAHDDDPSPLKHRPDCRCLGHEVVLYPVRIGRDALLFNDKGDPQLSEAWTRKGWKFMRDGLRMYRTQYLCRDCIGIEGEKESRKAEYQKLCKAARGEETRTYAQMLASQ